MDILPSPDNSELLPEKLAAPCCKKTMTTIHLDRSILFEDFARAMLSIGCELRTDADGSLKIVKRRARKP